MRHAPLERRADELGSGARTGVDVGGEKDGSRFGGGRGLGGFSGDDDCAAHLGDAEELGGKLEGKADAAKAIPQSLAMLRRAFSV